jgi:hypothetical protein
MIVMTSALILMSILVVFERRWTHWIRPHRRPRHRAGRGEFLR